MAFSRQQTTISRSEQIRRRRQAEEHKRTQETRQQSYRVTHPQTVVARNLSQALPLYQSTALKARKAHYYKLSNTGSEVHVKGLPNLKVNAKTLSGLTAIIALVLILFMAIASNLRISSIELRGAQRVTAVDIQNALGLANSAIISVDPSKLISQLQSAFPELANVRVKISLPAKVTISASERVPIISWSSDRGNFWLDVEGAVFAPRGDSLPPLSIQADANPPSAGTLAAASTLPVAIDTYPQQIDPAVLTAIMELSAKMPQETTFLYSHENGLGWIDPGGWKVFVGLDLSDLGTKIVEYQAIVKQLDLQGIRPVMVSVEHIDAPFFRTQ